MRSCVERGSCLEKPQHPAVLSTLPVTCPTCFEIFEVSAPHLSEVPCTVDYDCEVCCRPMSIEFYEEDGEVVGQAFGLND